MEQFNFFNVMIVLIDVFYEWFGIFLFFNIQFVVFNFYSICIILFYLFDGDVEQLDVFFFGFFSEFIFEEWKYDYGCGYIMVKVMGVFFIIFIYKNFDEIYVRVEFYFCCIRDDVLRVFGGVVDEKEGLLFLKGGYFW